MNLQFEISLRDLAVVAVADSVWQKEEIENKVKTYFISPTLPGKLQKWDLITKDVFRQIDPISLPNYLYPEVVQAAATLGYKRRDWYRFCRMKNIFRDVPKEQLYEHYLRKMYWTYYGIVDEEKIVGSWFSNPNCDLWKVYVMASCFCSEEFVKEVWTEVKKTHPPEDFEKLTTSFGWHMAAYWNKYFSNNLENFISYIQSKFWYPNFYDSDKSLEENMFLLCVERGYKTPAKKFWSELNDDKKAECIKTGIYSVFYPPDILFHPKQIPIKNFIHDQFLAIYFHSVNNIPSEQAELIKKMDFEWPLGRAMTRWPWVKLILPFVNYNKEYFSKLGYKKLFYHLSYEVSGFLNSNKDTLNKRTIFELWNELPQDLKEYISDRVMENLFSSWDIVNLKKILNDKDLVETKDNLIKKAYYHFIKLVKMDKQKMIKEFFKLLIPSKWDKNIQINMELVYEKVLEGEIDLADEILTSICSSEEELNDYKNEINIYYVCYYFILKNQFEFADKFLYWKLIFHEAVKNYKLGLLNESFNESSFPLHNIYMIWSVEKENVAQAILKSNDFLNWLFDSKKLIHRFLNYLSVKITGCPSIIKRYEICNDLLNYCKTSEEKMSNDLKFLLSFNSQFSHANSYQLSKYMRNNEVDSAKKYLNYAIKNEKEREIFMEDFLKSSASALSVKLFILVTCGASTIFKQKPSKEEISEEMKKFIKFWMVLVKENDQHPLRMILKDWPNASRKMIQNEQQLREDRDSDDDFDAEDIKKYKTENHELVYCDQSNFKIFMDLFKKFDDGDDDDS